MPDDKGKKDSTTLGQNLLESIINLLPVGVCLTDETGHYRMMNDAYCEIYEYDRGEMLGKHYSVIMPPDQLKLANAHYQRLLSGDVGIPVERKRQRKDGSIVYIEAANALLEDVDGKKMVITTIRDISERTLRDKIIQIRLDLIEAAQTQSAMEVMQKALDEIEDLTKSKIGFYHFVDDDQQSLSLQAWSTRTQEVFCQAEGEGLHYPIANAGVWTDCVYERKPVIHNDYPSLPHRKGLPEGHAEVQRELVVPIIRKDRVVAILGVGNKPEKYSQQDVDLVSYIADVVWTVVDKRKADEQILQLNTRLAHLAMVDELTDLPNRRAFFAQAAKEISRVQRNQSPLSLLMLDLDEFKNINDTFGHLAGDLVLESFAKVLRDQIRNSDLAARMGGEEFSILLPDTDSENAVISAERIRQAIEQADIQVNSQPVRLTVSIGVATYDQNSSDLESIIKRADDGLYQAKHQGRNMVVFLD